jgi:hypothetical protein
MDDGSLTRSAPLDMTGMKIECWKCGARMPVVALVAPEVEGTDHEVCVLADIVSLPKDVLGYVQSRVPTFQLRYSKTVQGKYYANTCPTCGVISGDFFLHSEPGAPFFPTCEDEAGLLYLTEVPIQGPVRVQAGCQLGSGELILSHAKRIP